MSDVVLEKDQCPRCGHWIPNDLDRGGYPGALSRYDNETYVCSGCGVDEALKTLKIPTPGDPVSSRTKWYDRTGVRRDMRLT